MKKYRFNKEWEAYVFLSPWIIGVLCFTSIPMLMSLYFSFTDFDILTQPLWIGITNYLDIIEDVRFLRTIRVTFTYVVLSVPFQLAFALILANFLKREIFGIRFYRAVYYLPSLFGGSVAVAILWRQLFNLDGVFNQFLLLLNIRGINWISTPSTALYTIILLVIWQFGASMVIFLAGLKQIPVTFYEAAKIDGASKMRIFFLITLPLLTPVVFFNVVMGVINAFQAFTPAFIISGGTGGPVDSLLFYSLYVYIKGFQHFSMGYASALAWVLLVIIGAVTGIMFLAARKWVYYND